MATALIMSTPAALVAVATVAGPASANECSGSTWKYNKPVVVSRSKKDLSGVMSKRNSNSKESSTLSVSVSTNKSDSSTVTVGASTKIDAYIAEVEAKFEVSVTEKISKGVTRTNRMVVEPLKYGRMKWQSIHTTYKKTRQRYYGASCSLQRETVWKASMITSEVHFAECQDRKNICTPY